ncbi:hypothetical protein THASP1DRAFT_28956 [Thamnocephalis sphaerospora]|uniref:MalT-like TPR region domain-containing protein n=1 Tax=Thamnocephalis sphaerospora TaxID=78915 RepID=A0A4P9XUX0_9FUNG|nr:hypothetical protein THASP1DRAFT_28956 [Thamnocephalis sphaerospora]|eukprot:RKP09250.1 hypothetical protein THASP1DRAFT_28956 [Thamnocephalis sphaerospora]
MHSFAQVARRQQTGLLSARRLVLRGIAPTPLRVIGASQVSIRAGPRAYQLRGFASGNDGPSKRPVDEDLLGREQSARSTYSPGRFLRSFPRQKNEQLEEDAGSGPLRLADVLPELVEAKRPEGAFVRPTPEDAVTRARKALVRAPRFVLQVAAIVGAVTATLTGIIWLGLHTYAEKCSPTDRRFSGQLRSELRNAYMLETLVPSPADAERYLRKAFAMLEESGLPSADPSLLDVILGLRFWLGYTIERQGRLDEAAELYREVLDAWGAAVADQASMAANDRSLAVSRFVAVSRRLGEVLARMDAPDEAGYVLWNAVRLANLLDHDVMAALAAHRSDDQVAEIAEAHGDHSSPEAVRCVLALANLMATQRQFDNALTLYSGALRAAQFGARQLSSKAATAGFWTHPVVPCSTTWTCLDAQVMARLAEIYAARGDDTRTEEWSRKGLALAKAGVGKRECDTCSGLILGNLALMQEIRGNQETALQLYTRAHTSAKRASDRESEFEYANKMRMLRAQLEEEEMAAPAGETGQLSAAPKQA